MSGPRAVVALDVGGTKTAAGLFLEDGSRLYYRTCPTAQSTAETSLAQLAEMAKEAIDACPRHISVCAAGIIVPGWVNRASRTVWAPNISGWDHIRLEERLAAILPLPIILESDRSGYVLGEAWTGAACGLQDVVFLAVGSGIGAGILCGGRLVHGKDDLAGAVGWMALSPSFRDEYARMGCFEYEASGNSVGRKGTSTNKGFAGARAEDVISDARKGVPEASCIVDEAVLYLGMGVANLISTLNPEMVVLGGGLFQSGEWLLERVRRETKKWAQPFAFERTRIVLSALGDSAGLCGAARIALDYC
jgi:glucokinase